MTICKVYSGLFGIISFILFIFSVKFMIQDYSLIIEYSLICLNSSNIIMTILFDWMSLLFMSFVLFISSMVIYYSEEYMEGDLNLNRFILLVVMFVLSMMLLIISPNLISILLGWDGLGLVSYCLVIYYQNVKSYNAGMLTALSNRIGDVALLMSIAWMLNFGSWSFVFYLSFLKNDSIMELISLLVVLAAMTKSAQIPFSSWLPAAMAAPTPVSSLVHSSTLVTAGVYLLIRFNLVFSDSLKMMFLLIASLTMFMSGLGANFEFDLKKIIALSTLSQLGLMMSILALGSYELAFFHLLTHALFKALLFMCAGAIIHSMNNCQDIRYMGNLINQMPLVCSFFNICNFSLCGLPFLSGFYSKDLIVEVMTMNTLNLLIYFLFYISIGLTVCYSFRLSYYSLSGSMNYISLNCLSEKKSFMIYGMLGLIFLVVFSGSLLSWLIFPSPYFICLPLYLKLMTLFMVFLGMFIGYELAKFKINYHLKSLQFLTLSSFLAMMWNMPMISTLGINYYPVYLGNLYTKIFDQGWMEYYGGQQLKLNLQFGSKFLQFLSINHLKIYFMMMVIWLGFVLIFF
uniref:NADH-ubiquinone oxidoreductase chain 5 n=1 Tax=Monochamus alternatus alternatus TaxID=2756270 RepID=A0A7D6F4X8_MONAT|nr:NADH dehydrogenase subunit 5 [Monochamus alternatus alternatus]QLM01485.1 NADH dehydrogenase subunit 5 [Monochamus alternatus alternatus]